MLPYHNPTILASQIAMAAILFDGRYEFGALRGHGWIPAKAGVPVAETRDRYEESLEILFRALAEELRENGILVNAICPGSVDTDMLKVGMPGGTAKMTAGDVARVALFLAAESPPALTGSCIDVFG